MSTTGASEHEETISTHILHVHWKLPTVQVPPQILNICSLQAGSLVWMGSCKRELARRMGLFCASFFLAGFAGSRYPNKWACSQATIFDTNSIIPCNNKPYTWWHQTSTMHHQVSVWKCKLQIYSWPNSQSKDEENTYMHEKNLKMQQVCEPLHK